MDNKRVSMIKGGEGVTVTVEDAVRNDSGVYTCVVSSEEDQRMASAFVNITGPLLTCDGK